MKPVSLRTMAVTMTAVLALATNAMAANPKILIGSVTSSDHLAAYVAIQEGFFSKRGLDVTMQSIPGGSVVPGLQSNSIQVAGVPVTNLLLGVDGGLDMRVVAGGSITRPTDKVWGVLSTPASGVKTAKDLVGKKVAVTSVGGLLYLLTANWLDKNGVKISDVGVVEAPLEQMGDLMKSGAIQAGTSAEPLLSRAAEVSGAEVRHYFAEDLPNGTIATVFAAAGSWADQNPQAMSLFREAIVESSKFISANPAKAKEYLIKYANLPPAVAEKAILPSFEGTVSREQLQYWDDLLVKLGALKKSIDVTRLQK
jgi:NitT/TauT family transport system substrate-binding protein